MYTRWQCTTVQDRTIQHNTVQYNTTQHNTITHITQNNTQLYILEIKKKQNQKRLSYTIKTKKRVEPKVDESVLKATRYTEQSANQTVRHSVSHVLPKPTPHSNSLPLHTLHISPNFNSFPFTAFSWPSPHFTSLHFTSLHFTSLVTFQLVFLQIPDFVHISKSLHFTSLNTFLTFSLYILDFPTLQNPFTSLHLSHFSPFSWKYSISSPLRIPPTSRITFLTRFLKKLGLKWNALCCTGQPWTRDLWVDVANSAPPFQPANSLSTVQYQPAGEGATLFATPAQSSPVVPLSQTTWVSPVLHWSSCPRFIGTFVSLTRCGTLRAFHLHGGQAPGR